jgi:hypothetical protein
MARHAMHVGALIAGVGLTIALAGTAQAIPITQARCATALQTITTASGLVPLSGLNLSINNGFLPQSVIVQVSADMGVDLSAEVRLAYSIDGGPPQEGVFGPANFANHQQFFETRATIAVIPLGPGFHTIAPHWRISGAPGKNAQVVARCATVEASTR